MTNIGLLSVLGLILIVLVLIGWIFMTYRANKDPAQHGHGDGKLKRGPVSGGAIHGDPGQNILTGEAPRMDEPEENRPKNSPMDL
jgi:hypothetical protein